MPRRLAERYGFEVVEPATMVLEGGSIEPNGAGSLLTTESCLLNPNRNPDLSRAQIEDYLKTYLGVSNVLWLGDGIAGDDTDGHVDDLARFVARDTIVTVVEDDPADANYAALSDNLERLRAMRDQDGRPFRIETLPMPRAIYCEGTRLPASYANFYIANGGIVMPAFDCDADSIAAATLARLFPGRRVVAIPSSDLVWGLGAIHCLTQQHPLASESLGRRPALRRQNRASLAPVRTARASWPASVPVSTSSAAAGPLPEPLDAFVERASSSSALSNGP